MDPGMRRSNSSFDEQVQEVRGVFKAHWRHMVVANKADPPRREYFWQKSRLTF
jgi:hypothetical protein